MKRMAWSLFIAFVMAMPSRGWASAVTMDGPMTDANAAVGQATNKNFTLDTSQHDIDYLSLQVNYSPGSYTNQTFTDGVASTGSLTVVSYAQLSSATATNSITITSNTALGGLVKPGNPPAVVYLAGRNLTNGVEWTYDVNFASNTACSLASAIGTYTAYLSTCGAAGGSVVFSTAPTYGTSWNQGVAASTAALTVSNGGFTGGQDNAFFTINGVSLFANKHWYPVTSNAATATSIASAITSSATAVGMIAAAGTTNTTVVYATSTAVGTATTYTITSSSASRLSTVNAFGGANASFALNGSAITIASHGFPVGLGVSLTSATGTSNLWYNSAGTAVQLGQGTTYYAIPLTVNTVALATSSANAVLGTAITFISSQTKATTDTYMLQVSTTGNTGSFGIWASNDGTLFQQVGSTTSAIPSVSPSTATFIDTGLFDWKYYQLRVVAPQQGAMPISAIVHGERR